MNQRESISKKTRFNVFKRDSFQCQYCGQVPPKVTLEIDHVLPVSKGGKSHIDNLITACFDCNRGKSDGLLTSVPMSIVDKTELLKEKQEQVKAFEKLIKSIERKTQKDIDSVQRVLQTFHENMAFNECARNSVKRFLIDLPLHEVQGAMEKACIVITSPHEAFKYFCGICWKKIKGDSYGSR